MNTQCCYSDVHERIKADASAWHALPCIGSMPTEDDDGNPCTLELRNCTCGSTLAIEVRHAR